MQSGARSTSDTAPLLLQGTGLLVCHARISGGWLLLTREAMSALGERLAVSQERIMRSHMVVLYGASPALA
jgi:hypothetical protein